MAIVPGVEPVQGRQQVEPFSPLPTQQIMSSTQRLTKRLQRVRGAHADLMAQMANQELLPQDQEAFDIATKGVRDNLNQLAEDDRLYNKLPQVRREARRFAEISKAFKQNKNNVQESLKNLQETENIPDRHRALIRQRIMRNAGVGLTDKGTVDPNTISQTTDVQPGQDPREFLNERLSDVEDITVRNRTTQNGNIIKSERSAVTFDRLQSQGLRELGFAVQDSDKELTTDNLQRVGQASPEVERWMQRERLAAMQGKATEMGKPQGVPVEDWLQNQDAKTVQKVRNSAREYVKDRSLNMINTVASRHISGDQDPKITIKSDPRVDSNGDSGSSQDSRAKVSMNPGIDVPDPQADVVRNAIKKRQIAGKIQNNENISKNQYDRITEMMSATVSGGNQSSVPGAPRSGPNSASATGTPRPAQERQVIDQFGEATFEAYKQINRAEQNIDESLGEFALEQKSYDFSDRPKQRNQVERNIFGENPKNLQSDRLNQNQIRTLLSDDSMFNLMNINTNGDWLMVKPTSKAVDAMEGEGFFSGREKPDPGQPILLSYKGRGIGGQGTREGGFIDSITKGLPEDVRNNIRQGRKVSGQKFGEDWTPVKTQPDVSIKLGNVEVGGDLTTGPKSVRPSYNAKVKDQAVTFGEFSDRLLDSNVEEQGTRQAMGMLAQYANSLPMVRELIRNPNTVDRPLDAGTISQLIADWHEDRENMDERQKEIVKTIMNSPIPADKPKDALSIAEEYKKLR